MSTHTVQTLETFQGGVASPQGFTASGQYVGIKAAGRGLDLALIVSDRPATAAGVFTTNKAQAAPVTVSKAHLAATNGTARAVIVNSGCANACTGAVGMRDAHEMTSLTASLVGCPEEQVLVASTGVIGVNLKMDKIRAGLPGSVAALGGDQGPAAAKAIMTTDPFPKEAAARVSINGVNITVGGMAKGSGMIEPMMATMLGFIATDACVSQSVMKELSLALAEGSFNRVTVDGDTSTNDSLVVIASNKAGNASITSLASEDGQALLAAMLGVAR
ncbi:MAG: bifunctional ornithine acetyltransferase/N-acetylglutamate synthase, partial [Vicinamibacterales bacterium]